MVDAMVLSQYLKDHINQLIILLEKLGCHHISYNDSKREIRAGREGGNNPTSVLVSVDNLTYCCFPTGDVGSIYTIIMRKFRLTFAQSLQYIVKVLDIGQNTEFELYYKPKQTAFGGFFKKYKYNNFMYEPMTIYPDDILNKYSRRNNIRFLRDNINGDIQEKFSLRFDDNTNRIVIPQWDIQGNLVGIQSRANEDNSDYRWFPLIPYKNSQVVYGYHINYDDIAKEKTIIITESAKGVMQLASMGYNYGLATNGSNISEYQSMAIKMLNADNIILAFDEGLSQAKLKREAMKLNIHNPIINKKVGYIYDPNNDILCDKQSPTDLGKEKFDILRKSYVKYLN